MIGGRTYVKPEDAGCQQRPDRWQSDGEPTLLKSTNGTPVANFTSRQTAVQGFAGQWRENVCFVVAWYKLADSCYQYLRKGSGSRGGRRAPKQKLEDF